MRQCASRWPGFAPPVRRQRMSCAGMSLCGHPDRDASNIWRNCCDAVSLADDCADSTRTPCLGDPQPRTSNEAPDYGDSPESRGGCTIRLSLRSQDPQAIQTRAMRLGVELAPARQYHGPIIGHIADPFGHLWEIGKLLRFWPPECVAQKSTS
jgi:hypothetical protein